MMGLVKEGGLVVGNPGEEKEFVEHLEELRVRVIRSLIYAVLGALICWYKFGWIRYFLLKPIMAILNAPGDDLSVFTPVEAFILKMEVSLIAGIVVASPFILLEIWRFVAPALYAHEKAYVYKYMIPSFLLLCAGIFMAYEIIPFGLKFLARFAAEFGATQHLRVSDSIKFMAKLYLAFGLIFQLPIVIMVLVKLGLVSTAGLRAKRKYAILAIFVMAAIITPTVDAVTMLMLAVPLCLLYELTIWFARVAERG